jgi:hypothetical protein
LSDDKAAEAVIAFLDAVDAGIVQARKILGQPTQKPKFQFDAEQIKWEEKQSTSGKGPYELAVPENNVNNPSFAVLFSHLKDVGTPETHSGYLYWIMNDGKSIGRKKRAKTQ